jgi:RNA polymerase sigma-70 factor, ECF subfamily
VGEAARVMRRSALAQKQASRPEPLMPTQEDTTAFLKEFIQVQPALRSYLYSLLHSRDHMEDVFQEVSTVLWQQYAKYDRSLPFLNWAIGIARIQAASWRRKHAKSRIWLDPHVEEKLAVTWCELEDHMNDRRHRLRACLERIGAVASELLTLRYEKSLSLQQIADVRRTSVNAVNKALGKIRLALMRCAAASDQIAEG